MPPRYNPLLCRNILEKNVFFKLCNLAVTIGLTFVRSSKARSQVLDVKLALRYWTVELAEMYRDFSKATFLKSLQRYVLNA